jgi:hypothetical protein
MSAPGRHPPEAAVLRQTTNSPQGLSVSGLSPKRELLPLGGTARSAKGAR